LWWCFSFCSPNNNENNNNVNSPIYKDLNNLGIWVESVHRSLQYKLDTYDNFQHEQKILLSSSIQNHNDLSKFPHTKELIHILLSEEDNDIDDGDGDGEKEEEEDSEDSYDYIVKGIPLRPLYKELAHRLYRWSQRSYYKNTQRNNLVLCDRLWVPDKELGLQEMTPFVNKIIQSIPAPPKNSREIKSWIWNVPDLGILRILGIRTTVGSFVSGFTNENDVHYEENTITSNNNNVANENVNRKIIVIAPPSNKSLVQAANVLHSPARKSLLTVSARARSKHAHRTVSTSSSSSPPFFGIAKGNTQQQNRDTEILLRNKIIKNAVWINIHKFGGIVGEGQYVLEIREKSGYGARWLYSIIPSSSISEGNNDCMGTKNNKEELNSGVGAERLQFRGFLEPQMEGGHEKRWRH